MGTEYQVTDKLKVGALYNQYRVNGNDESVDLNASSASFTRNSVDMDQWEISGRYKLAKKLTVAAQVSSRDYSYENADYTVDGETHNDANTLSTQVCSMVLVLSMITLKTHVSQLTTNTVQH